MPPSMVRAKRPSVSSATPAPVAVRTPPPQRKAPQVPPSNAAALAALRDKKPLTDPAQKELQDKVGNGAVAAGLARGPGSDPKFGVLKKDVAHKKRTIAKSHPPAGKEAGAAQEASVPPKDDAVAQGKTANAEKMNDAKPKDFDKDAFVAAVEKAIAEKAPKNLEQADEFADSGKPAEVKAEVQGKVGEGKSDSASQIADTTAAPPDTSAAVTKQVVPLAGDRPPGTPATPDPAKATPDKLPPSATDLSAGPAHVNQEMSDAQVTETQLKKSNEPSFNAAVKDKKTAEQHSEATPPELRKNETAQLHATTAAAKRLGTAAMAAITNRRVRTGQQVGSGKSNTKTSDEEKRAQVTTILQNVFDTMKTDVEGILKGLDKLVDDQFTRGEKAARDAFTAEHRRKMDEYKDRRYGGRWGLIKWGHDKLFGLPEEANQIFVEARDHYVKAMRKVISDVADTIGRELTRAKQRIAKGRDDLQTEAKKLPKDLQALGKQAAAGFADKFDELTQSVDDKSTELVDTLATKYTDAVKSVDDEIAAEKEKNKGLVDKALDGIKGVIKTILELKNMLLGVLAKAGQAVMGILKDPIGFLGNLVRAVGGGLKQFKDNALTHLQQGVMAWLLGTAATAGITLPTKFDVLGILLMIASLLGLSWPNIKARLAKKVPKEAMMAVEAGEHALPIIIEVQKRGIGALWDDLKERVGDLKKNLVDNLVSFLLPTIIIAGITWIISLFNPASAFIRACKMIIDIIRFIVNNGRQILEFVNTVLDAVIAISKGGGGGVPGLVEKALARSIPVLIGALAALLGIGGIAGKVKEVFQKLAKPVNKAIDWVIDKIVGLIKKVWAKIKALAKKLKDKFGKKKPKKDQKKDIHGKDEEEVPPKTVERSTTVGTESHTLQAQATEKRVTILMASEGFDTIHVKVKVLRQLANDALRSRDSREQDWGGKLNKALDRVEARALKIVTDYGRMSATPQRERQLDDWLNDLSEMISDIGVTFQIPGLTFRRPTHNPVPLNVDGFGRATGYSGRPLSRASEGRGTPSGGTYLPGIDIPGVGTLQRGHLLANLLGGSGTDRRNLSPITLTANTAMKKPEKDVADFIYTGDISNQVLYDVEVHHHFLDPTAFQAWLAATYPPVATDAAEQLFDITRTHRPSAAEINKALGRPPRTSAQHQHILRGLAFHLLRSDIVISITATAGPLNRAPTPSSPSPISNNIPPP